MKKSKILVIISIMLFSSPIVFTSCSSLSKANKVATTILSVSDMITNYDKQARHYIDVVNKAKKGDAGAIIEAASLLTKAKEYKKDLDKFIPEMTSSQKSDVQRIEKSILAAAKSLIN